MRFVKRAGIVFGALIAILVVGNLLAGPSEAPKNSSASSAEGPEKAQEAQGSEVVVRIATAGGAGYSANLAATGAETVDINEKGADSRVVMHADENPSSP